MSPGAQLYDHSLPDVDRACLLACADGFQQRYIHVSPLGRYGYTSARLFLARFDLANVGPQYVVKIDQSPTVEMEQRALEDARAYFHDALSWRFEPSPSNGHAAILYRLFSSPGGDIQELRDLYVDLGVPIDELIAILERLYGACAAAHMNERTEVVLGEHYEWYLRSNRIDRIREILGTSATVDFLGAQYPNPCGVLDELTADRASVPFGFVHGDLHPNNVVINEGGMPSFIDFAWAHPGDVLIDHVLMECSLRFLLFPRHIMWEEQRQVTEWLTAETGTQEVLDACARGSLNCNAERYERMAHCVSRIRAGARVAAGVDYTFNEYLRTQFFVLYGLSKLDSYPFLQSVDALGIIAKELAKR